MLRRRSLTCESLEARLMLAGDVVAEIVAVPSVVAASDLVDVTVRVLFTGDDDDGPWDITGLYLRDDSDGFSGNNADPGNAYDDIVSLPNPAPITVQDAWQHYTFHNVPLGAFVDDGDTVELFVWAQVDDNDFLPFTDPVGASSNRIVVVTGLDPIANIDLMAPNPAQPPSEVIQLRGSAQYSGGSIVEWQWQSDLNGLLGSTQTLFVSSYDLTVGVHEISLRVQASDGRWSDPTTASLQVLNASPTVEFASISPENPVFPGDQVTATVVGIDHDEQGNGIDLVEATVAGAVYQAPPGLALVFPAPPLPDAYSVTVRVRDDEGTWSPPVVRSLTVAIAEPPSADFNDDGRVNGTDFLAWQRGFGTAYPLGTKSTGDADDDQDVDEDDLAVWQTQFGEFPDTTVPESASATFKESPLSLSVLATDEANLWISPPAGQHALRGESTLAPLHQRDALAEFTATRRLAPPPVASQRAMTRDCVYERCLAATWRRPVVDAVAPVGSLWSITDELRVELATRQR